MAEFSATANLDVAVSQDSIRAARRQIENELGDVEVDVGSSTRRPTGRQPRDPQSGRFMQQQGSEQRLVELIELATERNELLEDFEGGGGGGAVRTAGTFGLGTRLAGGGGLAAGGPFAALAALTLGGFGLAGLLSTPETDRPGPGPTVPQEPTDTTDFGPRFPGVPEGLVGDPAGGFRQPPGPAGNQPGNRETNINANPNINVNAQGPTQNEIEMLIEGRFRDFSNEIRREIEGLLGGDSTGPRTTQSGGGGGPRPF